MISSIINWFAMMALAIGDLLNVVFEYIFPEFPRIGIFLVMLCGALFLFYCFKGGPQQGAKVAIGIFIAAVFFLYLLHTILRLANITLAI
jgi:hypothetical protein